ncbi:MAG: ComEC/Rec2 family competence protein [Bacteroidota bacterium]
MQIKWASFAFIRFTFCYIIGILTYLFVSPKLTFILWLLPVFLLIYTLLVVFTDKEKRRKQTRVFAAIALLFLLSAGYENTRLHDITNHPLHLHHVKVPVLAYTGKISSLVKEKEKGSIVTINIKTIKTAEGWQEAVGKVNLFLAFKKPYPNINDQILIKGYPKEVSLPLNPEEFNFKKYLNFQQIYYQDYIKEGQIHITQQSEGLSFLYFAQSLRKFAKNSFQQYISPGNEQDIALALVLGIKDQLDVEIKNAYSGAGAMHVLAVSGLHVGIIYKLISFFLLFFQKKKFGKLIFGLAIATILWFYAALTGFSPSVVRATTMFTFVLVAHVLNRKSSIYNTLAVSALCMLIYNPYNLLQVGFQLSYIAVYGIVYLYPKIYHIVSYPLGIIADKLWQLSAVSIAAQIATFPLTLYYFHQFPVYFLLANPFVIMIAGAVVCIGVILPFIALLHDIPALIFGKFLELIILFMNHLVTGINQLPFAKTNPIYVQLFDIIFIYLIIFLLVQFFERKKLIYLKLSVISLFLLSISSVYHNHLAMQSKQLTVHHINKHSCVSIIYQQEAYILTDKTLLNQKDKLNFHINNHLLKNGVKDYHFFHLQNDISSIPFPIDKKDGVLFLVIEGKKIALIEEALSSKTLSFSADVVIVRNDAINHLDQLKNIKSKQLLLDGSNSWKTMNLLTKQKKATDARLYYTKKSGAFSLAL